MPKEISTEHILFARMKKPENEEYNEADFVITRKNGMVAEWEYADELSLKEIYVLGCVDYDEHHKDDTTFKRINHYCHHSRFKMSTNEVKEILNGLIEKGYVSYMVDYPGIEYSKKQKIYYRLK